MEKKKTHLFSNNYRNGVKSIVRSAAVKCPHTAVFPASANPDRQRETRRRGPFTAGTAYQPGLPGTLVGMPAITLLIFQPFHRPKVRSKGSFSGRVPKFSCVLSNANPSNSSDKARHVPVQLLHLSSHVSICAGDAGACCACNAQPGKSRALSAEASGTSTFLGLQKGGENVFCESAAKVCVSSAQVPSSFNHLLVAWMRTETVGFGNSPNKNLFYLLFF